MSFSDKIDEWIAEAETRPASALTILKLVANRLRQLSERDEELLAENIALRDGTRVEEYQKRIAHLEYQLDMLKRRLGGDETALEELAAEQTAPLAISLLIYNANGRFIRLEVGEDVTKLGRIGGEIAVSGEWPRLLAVPSHEEVLLLFTSGRVSTLTIADIPASGIAAEWTWEQAAMPDEPHAGEMLAGVMPLSRLPLADFFVQSSRRGCVKKTMTSLAQSILDNHYLGKGALQKSDQPFDVVLCGKGERLVLVTYEGRVLGVDIDDLSYTLEERLRLRATDFVVASFILRPDDSLLCLTQDGKVVHRDGSYVSPAKSQLAKGQVLIPESRLAQGTRFVGAIPVRNAESDRMVVLDARGNLTLISMESASGSGVIRAEGLVLSIGAIPFANGKRLGS